MMTDNPATVMPELRECPFCGENHTQIVRRPWKGTKSFETFVLCGPCQITGPSSVARDMEETCKAYAIELWNHRTAPPPDVLEMVAEKIGSAFKIIEHLAADTDAPDLLTHAWAELQPYLRKAT